MKKLIKTSNKYKNMPYRINMYRETYGIKVLEFVNNIKQLGISVRRLFDTELEIPIYTVSKYVLIDTKPILIRKTYNSIFLHLFTFQMPIVNNIKIN